MNWDDLIVGYPGRLVYSVFLFQILQVNFLIATVQDPLSATPH